MPMKHFIMRFTGILYIYVYRFTDGNYYSSKYQIYALKCLTLFKVTLFIIASTCYILAVALD